MSVLTRALPFVLLTAAVSVVRAQPAPAEHAEFFEKRIRPLLVSRCQACHNAKLKNGGLDLTSALPKDLVEGRLLHVVSYEERVKMPPAGKLPESEIALLREWVKVGAPWPGAPAATATSPVAKKYTRAQREFWSFRPVQAAALPAVKNQAWVRSPIDRFILAKLEERGLTPAAQADKLTLIRRATLDLTGLPPTHDDVQAFVADTSPQAFEKVVDRLLASPQYGERWGRHWLDVARYADSTGADEDHRYPYAWRYRDYVIDAFNRDLPYDEFIREQIAGDLQPPPAGSRVNKTGIVATGFLALGPKLIAEQDKLKMFYDIVDEQIDVTGKALLGLTIACARCHDHKFDPISTRDYYSLASIFASTKQLKKLEGTVSQLYFAPLVDADIAGRYEDHQKKIEEKQQEIAKLTGEEGKRIRESLSPRLADYMLAARTVYADGKDAAEVARARSLDAAVLERWAKYLKPSMERRIHLEPWYEAPEATLADVAKRYQAEFLGVAAERHRLQEEWKKLAEEAKARGEKPPEAPKFQPGDDRFYTEVVGGPFGLPEKDKEQVFSADGRARFQQLNAELKQLKDSSPPEPPFACAVGEGDPVEQRVFLRGNPESKGELAPKQFPTILAGDDQPPIAQGSGRRELAEWLADARNPLTTRVMVNRIWQGHFGEGLVRTPSNFGITGERPTHPELLEWLAAEFVARKWSVKSMHRLIMLSSVYGMSSEITQEKREKDADNRLLSRFTMRRMSVEEIRDSLLALDGSIDLTVGGSMQSGFGTDKEFSDDRKSLDPAESRRRTVYLPLRRSNLPSLLNLFDFGDATTSNEARTQTNVAPQALFMMNSKFVAERARALASKLMAGESDPTRRVRRAWSTVLGRPAEASEVSAALRYVETFPARPAGEEGTLLAWSSLCRTLMASNDFLYVH